MSDLEARLSALADEMFPPMPGLVGTLATRLAREQPPAKRGLPAPRRLALALALVALPVGVAAAIPPARDAALRWLGLAHVRVVRVGELPPVVRSYHGLRLGVRAESAAAASRRARLPVLTPSRLGAPDAIFIAGGEVVSLAYRRVPGIAVDPHTGLTVLITEVAAAPERELMTKMVGPGTHVTRVAVRGHPGVFFSGAVHELVYQLPSGTRVQTIPPRLAGNALVFETSRAVYRLEGRFGLRAALRLARSMRSSAGGP